MRAPRMLAAAIVVAALPAAAPASAGSPAEALQTFGLIGTWSPDCAGPYRVTYALSAERSAGVLVTLHGREIAGSEILDVLRAGAHDLSWTSRIKLWSLPDHPAESWMPEPGEIWLTTIEKRNDLIRPTQSRRDDGWKVSVKDGYIYVGEAALEGRSLIWRSTGRETLPLARCPSTGGDVGSKHGEM